MSGTARTGSQETASLPPTCTIARPDARHACPKWPRQDGQPGDARPAANMHHGWARCQQHCPAHVHGKTRHLSPYIWWKLG